MIKYIVLFRLCFGSRFGNRFKVIYFPNKTLVMRIKADLTVSAGPRALGSGQRRLALHSTELNSENSFNSKHNYMKYQWILDIKQMLQNYWLLAKHLSRLESNHSLAHILFKIHRKLNNCLSKSWFLIDESPDSAQSRLTVSLTRKWSHQTITYLKSK